MATPGAPCSKCKGPRAGTSALCNPCLLEYKKARRRAAWPTFACVICGGSFQAPLKSYNTKATCSPACVVAHERKMRGTPDRAFARCEECGRVFLKRYRTSRLCSRRCTEVEHDRVRRTRQIGRSRHIFRAAVAEKFDYWGGRCWMCPAPATTVDHVKPLCVGGPHLLANLRPACRSCNSRKGGRWHGPRRLAEFVKPNTD